MQVISIHTAKTQLFRLVDEAAADKEIITRAGKLVAKLASLAPAAPVQRHMPGRLARQLIMPEDFDAPLSDDVPDAFEGR